MLLSENISTNGVDIEQYLNNVSKLFNVDYHYNVGDPCKYTFEWTKRYDRDVTVYITRQDAYTNEEGEPSLSNYESQIVCLINKVNDKLDYDIIGLTDSNFSKKRVSACTPQHFYDTYVRHAMQKLVKRIYDDKIRHKQMLQRIRQQRNLM
jgi:hypothetical protein